MDEYFTNHVGETILQKFTDKPLYEKYKNKSEEKSISSPTRSFSKRNLYPTALHPSPLMIWWEEEIRKSRSNLPNEFDINEIEAAWRGVKNKWYSRVQKNRAIIKPMIEFNKFEWSILINLEGA